MYSFGDIKLKKPISVKKIAWTMGGFMIWTLPIVVMFGFRLHPVFLALIIIPPIVFGHYVTKPVFGGKTMMDWLQTQVRYLQQPRGWSDFRVDNDQQSTVYTLAKEIYISRRREARYLSRVIRLRKEKEKQEKKMSKKKMPQKDGQKNYDSSTKSSNKTKSKQEVA